VKKKCSRSETRLTWNAVGPQGATGPEGPTDLGAWATIQTSPGGASASAERNIAVQRNGVGDYTVTIIGGPCTTEPYAVTVTPEVSGASSTAFPVAYVVRTSGGPSFDVRVGVESGTFAQIDGLAFDVAVYCQ
jgi:hypothetical protein